jgi:hypothetical protein
MLGHAKASMPRDTNADLFDTDLDAVSVELDAAIKAAAAQDDPASIWGATAGRDSPGKFTRTHNGMSHQCSPN